MGPRHLCRRNPRAKALLLLLRSADIYKLITEIEASAANISEVLRDGARRVRCRLLNLRRVKTSKPCSGRRAGAKLLAAAAIAERGGRHHTNDQRVARLDVPSLSNDESAAARQTAALLKSEPYCPIIVLPDLARTMEASPLLIVPSVLTSERKLAPFVS